MEGNNDKKVNVIGHGSSGTEIYGGYIFEEYLKDLRGTKWAEKVDQMRRSDPVVKMILRAMKLPLLSQNWFIEKSEESPDAEWQKKLFEKVIFSDMSDSFTKTLAEILTFYDFGYSLFEKVHGVGHDSELGLYNTIKRLAYRSQKTIERWHVDRNGKLIKVYQEADGDTQRNVDLDAKFLVHFAPEMEGDNYEGVSILRPCYGPWLRKNEFLKLLAAGMSKYAIPTPLLEVPKDMTDSEEFDKAIEALECYTSNESGYLTFPEGWKLTVNNVTFDATTIRDIIDKENLEMTNSVLASFLLLGQGGGGSYSLSNDLSDFFAQTLQAAADHISEVFSKKIMQDVLDLNRPGQKVLCSLRCDSLRDKADTEFATTLKTFLDAKLINPDETLEDFIREKYKYPKKVEPTIEDAPSAGVLSFAEKKSPKNSKRYQQLIDELALVLEEFFRASNIVMGADFVSALERASDGSRNIYQATMKVDDPNTSKHSSIVEYLTMLYAVEVKNILKGTKRIELSEKKIDELMKQLSKAVDTFEQNPTNKAQLTKIKNLESEISRLGQIEIQKLKDQLNTLEVDRIKARARVLVDTQSSDVYKNINLYVQQNGELPDSTLFFDASQKAAETAEGPITTTAAGILATSTVSSTLYDYAAEEESGIQTMTFVAELDEDTTDLCRSLDGTTLPVGDPKIDEYQTPLHHNCRSIWVPNYEPAETTGFPTLNKKATDQITLSEKCCDHYHKHPLVEAIKNVLTSST
jgi:SPP1 gp7 family putative phage head morphogenesis protein